LRFLLYAACAKDERLPIAIACTTAQRFSSLGIGSIGTLVITGIVNSWLLVGSADALTNADCGL
jgi:putative copper resistance protein D